MIKQFKKLFCRLPYHEIEEGQNREYYLDIMQKNQEIYQNNIKVLIRQYHLGLVIMGIVCIYFGFIY